MAESSEERINFKSSTERLLAKQIDVPSSEVVRPSKDDALFLRNRPHHCRLTTS
jgi:hypothetical protein